MFHLFDTHLPDTPYTKREIERIRANIAPLTGTPIAPFDEEAFRLFYKTGSRVEYEAIYFETRRRLCAYAALALWEDDPAWIAELERALSALLAEPTWALPAHVAGDADEKTRRRRGKGIALLATCVVPIFIGAALDGVLNLNSSDPFAILGVAAMFLMIGLGVYEVTAAPGEKKPLNELLKDE